MYLLIILIVAAAAVVAFVRWLEPRFAFFPFAGETQTPADFGLSFDAITIDTQDGERLRAWRIPANAPRAQVVYFHGNGGNLSNWAPILSAIARRGYSVFAIDYRGYGVSTGHPSERGLYRDADAAIAHAWTGRDPQIPMVYWGRSLGASIAAYAATKQRPDGVVVEAGFSDARSTVRGSALLMMLSLFASYRFPAAEFLARARVPVLVMHGDRDSVIPFPLGRELFERIAEPKEFVAIAGGDHNDAVAPDPQTYWSAIARFITSLTAATRLAAPRTS